MSYSHRLIIFFVIMAGVGTILVSAMVYAFPQRVGSMRAAAVPLLNLRDEINTQIENNLPSFTQPTPSSEKGMTGENNGIESNELLPLEVEETIEDESPAILFEFPEEALR
jgi:hypothetical protein